MADDEKFYDPADKDAPKEVLVTPAEGAEGRPARDADVIEHPSSKGAARNGRPIDEQDAPEEPPDGQLFEVPDAKGKAFDLKDILAIARRRNIPIEYSFKMSGKAIPAMSSLMDPFATSHLLLADCELKPFGVADALSEQGQTWLREKVQNAA